jgi:hypothetical protein
LLAADRVTCHINLKLEYQGVEHATLKAAGAGRANQLRRTGHAREYLGAARDFFGPPGVFSGLIGGRKKELVKPTTLNASKIPGMMPKGYKPSPQ